MNPHNFGFLQGRLTADPELKYFASGAAYTSVCVAAKKVRRDEYKHLHVEAQFFYVQYTNQKAENLCRLFKKGDAINVIYELDMSSWDKDGKKQSRLRLNGVDFGFCLGGGDKSTKSKAPGNKYTPSTPVNDAKQEPEETADTDSRLDTLMSSLEDLTSGDSLQYLSDDECPF